MKELYNWLFHYNPYTKYWAAFKREEASDYFNGAQKDSILRSTNLSTLRELIVLYEGNTEKIHKNLKL